MVMVSNSRHMALRRMFRIPQSYIRNRHKPVHLWFLARKQGIPHLCQRCYFRLKSNSSQMLTVADGVMALRAWVTALVQFSLHLLAHFHDGG
jgi:hypothetical protein